MYEPTTGRFSTLDPFFGDIQDPQSLHKYLYTHGDPINGIDPTGQMEISLAGALAATGIVCTVSAIAIPAIWDGYKHSYHVAANGNKESLFGALFTGKATWADFRRTILHFQEGYVAGAMNMLDTLTFHQIPVVHQANEGLWEEAGLSESWAGTASNVFAWAGTGALYSAAAVWTWSVFGGGTMDIAVSKGTTPWYIHIRYGANGVWEEALLGTGRFGLGGMNIYTTLTPTSGAVITGIPVLLPQAVLTAAGTGTAYSCLTAAVHAFLRGWGFP